MSNITRYRVRAILKNLKTLKPKKPAYFRTLPRVTSS
jgi:hypothetical protein